MKQNEQEKINLFSTANNRLTQLFSFGLLACCLVILASGCKTISNPLVRSEADYTDLPKDTITEIAYYLEEQVRAEEREPVLKDRPNLIIDTPEIKQASRSRAARYALVQDLLNSGHMLEQSDGKLAVIRTSAYKGDTTRQDRDRHALIVISENRDRDIIYDTLRRANGYSIAARSAIEELFFVARKSYLEPGQKFRIDGGEIQTH